MHIIQSMMSREVIQEVIYIYIYIYSLGLILAGWTRIRGKSSPNAYFLHSQGLNPRHCLKKKNSLPLGVTYVGKTIFFNTIALINFHYFVALVRKKKKQLDYRV